MRLVTDWVMSFSLGSNVIMIRFLSLMNKSAISYKYICVSIEISFAFISTPFEIKILQTSQKLYFATFEHVKRCIRVGDTQLPVVEAACGIRCSIALPADLE